MKKITGKEGGSQKISHQDREGMLQYYVLREYKPYMKIITRKLFPGIQFNPH